MPHARAGYFFKSEKQRDPICVYTHSRSDDEAAAAGSAPVATSATAIAGGRTDGELRPTWKNKDAGGGAPRSIIHGPVPSELHRKGMHE